MRSFGLLAVVDQKLEEEQLRKIRSKEKQVRRQQLESQEEEDVETEDDGTFWIMIIVFNQEIQEYLTLGSYWQRGQFLVHFFYSTVIVGFEKLQANLTWLKGVLVKYFPDIIFIENEIDVSTYDSFESFIYGVGPLAKRDGQNRITLFKKDNEDWYHF